MDEHIDQSQAKEKDVSFEEPLCDWDVFEIIGTEAKEYNHTLDKECTSLDWGNTLDCSIISSTGGYRREDIRCTS